MGKKFTKSFIKQYLTIQPQIDFGFGEYTYFVETPENEVLYFKSKREAKEFIRFYNDYKERFPERFLPKKSSKINTISTDDNVMINQEN
jgi:hypothetical protein